MIFQTYGKDKYERTIADVLLPDGTNVNHALVKEGWCWWYRKYAPMGRPASYSAVGAEPLWGFLPLVSFFSA